MVRQTNLKSIVRDLMEPRLGALGYKRRPKQPVFHLPSEEVTVACDCWPERDKYFNDRGRIGMYLTIESEQLMSFARDLFRSFELVEFFEENEVARIVLDPHIASEVDNQDPFVSENEFETHAERTAFLLSKATFRYPGVFNCATIKQFGETFSSNRELVDSRPQSLAVLAALVMQRNRIAALNFVPETGYTPRLRTQLQRIVEAHFDS